LWALGAVLGLLAGGCGSAAGGGGGAAANPFVGTDGIADLVDRVKGAVVNIDLVGPGSTSVGDAASGEPPPEDAVQGTGSGFVLRSDGLVVTNAHVVDGPGRLEVTFPDGRRLEGAVVGRDPVTDLALVRVNATGLPVLPLARPDSLRVGQFVVALGSPLGLDQTVTWGILSALDRRLTFNARVGFLQTDAPINPGNSGGPLLNLAGEVIGVNTAVARRSQGIGFALPVGTLNAILPQLERQGRASHAWLGVSVREDPEGGLLVGMVHPGSPAAAAGLQPGDRVLSLDGVAMDDAFAFIAALADRPVGRAVSLRIRRDGTERTLRATLDELPAQPPAEAGRFRVAWVTGRPTT
jgi:S1-C subfamily serine protease